MNSVFPKFKDEGEVLAYFGRARLIKYLDGEVELKGGSKEDPLAAHEWTSAGFGVGDLE